MRVLYCHRTNESGPGGNNCIAAIDFQMNDHLRLYGLRLLRMRDGKFRLFAPQSGSRRTATFSDPLVTRMTDWRSRRTRSRHERIDLEKVDWDYFHEEHPFAEKAKGRFGFHNAELQVEHKDWIIPGFVGLKDLVVAYGPRKIRKVDLCC